MGRVCNPPCKDCTNRTVEPNCHTRCAEYLEFKEMRDKISRKKYETAMLNRPLKKERTKK
jgi:hypothetical protein